MAYRVTNNKDNNVVLHSGLVLVPGQTLSVSEIGSTEIYLQRHGVITISREVEDADKDDARFVEIVNSSGGEGILIARPTGFQILNPLLPLRATWYIVAAGIPSLQAWKLKMRPELGRSFPFRYKYSSGPEFMSASADERIFADTAFDELHVQVPDVDGRVMELELWTK